MRFQISFIILFTSFYALGIDDNSMSELFKKYDSVMDQKRVELIDDVFTQQFIKNSGGKKELIKKIRSLPESLVQNKTTMSWRKGIKGEVYFAKLKEESFVKNANSPTQAEFIIKKENGKLKIDGTISDGE